MDNAIIVLITIFVINILYVTISTIRLLLTMKGYRYFAALSSVVEMMVYVLALSLVLNNLNNIWNVIAYSLGFGVGIVIGMKIEERLALGYITVKVITDGYNLDLPNHIRDLGYGVTSWFASGRDGERMVLEILTQRKNERKLYKEIISLDEKAFIVSTEPKQIYGGFWVKQMRKHK
ncbi:Uncharacterized protein conserved in bacteria (DUF2179) [Listeria grayi]|uniref:UPF0316 protein HMPREF0556_10090 n=3 Tax=Listeria grayi TaxID=1641 RepID=D7UUB5_LISGR|nr:DUF5698 domain-containing protein [Listeria grayi]EFI85363.1 hypothetical protein HMPREF0556_10090 [Listeria grayi DSM 20601]EUJ26861.1 hypothetical protein LMUR_12262 [Listeria grayi FSL F6-1183]MBC1922883.1 DUF2179 domain-containing protein [Listeria grayi]STY42937.1 Uncharacterized protein conserved in bacteria (DUF2179) [Listeria grayi]VEI33337.1 Uncharacterized protein conserved in bacteria (DUF2179) [Listeria grayi]